ncbi:MAG: UDP-N-acetylmuramoyl-tripeptide--D-alanyl-D-alanine ligase [Candidatus Staskawiczbacteria bacterium]|nr:UDP-N-acetylmuramoyl-tripeptide--D-alanyl-D-alanine ligase [Candidatus Staskawiczbacteria bacterium]
MYLILNTLWFIWMLKYVLFWLYLWQLKEYHLGRFVDHFRTHKGKKLLFSFEQIFKLVLLIFLLLLKDLFNFIFLVISIVYFAEFLIFVKNVFSRNFKKPVLTFKTIFLTAISFTAVLIFLWWTTQINSTDQPAWLLGFDIFTSLIISVIVLFFQPFFVFVRNLKLNKAKEKLEQIRKLSGLKVVAITGSYGKTSTKEFLSTILSKKFKVLATNKHQNSEIGVANCILNDLKPSHQVFIAEVGAYNKGKVKEVCNILKPKIGIVTGVNEQHLALFGSLENLLSAEGGGEMAQILEKENGLLIVNGDNKFCLDLLKKHNGKEKIYTENHKVINADIWADEISTHKDFISFLAIDKAGEMAHFNVNVLGKQNVQNLLGAILVAKELGMNFGEIAEACKNIKQEQAGMILLEGKHGITIVDSSYSSNPSGVFADLNYFSILSGKKVIVMPCLIELGKKSGEIHEKIGRKIAEACDFAIITSKDKFKSLKKGAMEAGMKEKNIILCDKSADIHAQITLFCKSGDSVLLEGRVPTGLLNLLKT